MTSSIWPRRLSDSIRNDPRRAAEVRVYDALTISLGHKWSVFYSRPWLGETATGTEIDGECDFVLAHPDYGVLCIEVKGGGIAYEPESDKWVSRDRHGVRHRIKDPVEQARRSKHALLDKARGEKGWPSSFVRFRHGVVFPDVTSVPQQLGADKPRELFATRPDLKSIDLWVIQRLTGGNETGIGSHGIRVLERLLAHPFQLHSPLSVGGVDDDSAIQELTPQQFHILDAFEELRRVAVGGGAGTGKTVLACEDARRQALAGRRTLLTCGSYHLATHLRATLRDTSVQVDTFMDLARLFAASENVLKDGRPLTPESAPEILFDCLSLNPDLRFDAVIVDEAQDFPPTTWVVIDALANRTEMSILHAYYDSNQRLYGELRSQFRSYELLPIRLTRNLRNTQHIHEATQRFYQGPSLTADGPVGYELCWIPSGDDRIEINAIAEVRRLVNVERVSPDDIVLLCNDANAIGRLARRVASTLHAKVAVSTVADFKGLESRFVVLLATRDMSDVPELAYVALSRARVHLSVVGSDLVLEWLKRGTSERVQSS